MQIQEIKTKLSLEEVLQHYNLPIDKNKMLRCPFHEDKTASLQVNLQKNLYKCHACGKKGDVIQFVQDYENISKHEALVKCTNLITNYELKITKTENQSTHFLQKMFNYFKNSIPNSKPAQEYLQSRSLDFKRLEIGYNAGQFHHGTRKDETLIAQCLEYGLLIDKDLKSKTGEKAYNVFGKWCICFALKNKENQVVSLYFRSTLNNENAKHFYLKDRQGIYPNYPNPNTKKLILTEAIIDSASLLQIDQIKNNYEILTCFGTNGLNEEIQNAIKELQELEEIIFFFDGDNAGNQAIIKYNEVLKEIHPTIKITKVNTPENEDINSLIQGHTEEILIHLLNERTEITSFSVEKTSEKIKEELPTNEKPPASSIKHQTPIDFLKSPNLIENLNKEIGKAGIVGEENSRMLLFLIGISYLNKNPLHALVQGSSGSGKTHIISRIADLMPPEDVLRFTRITESSLYNWGEFDLHGKIIIIEDLDGLKEDALYALREFISNQILRSSVTIKDKKGNNKSAHKIVKGQFSSLSATTKGETYEDNMSRSFLIAVDESKEQTARIIDYQNKRNAGAIDPNQNEKAINFIQQIIRNLKVYEVINPYATQLHLPEKVHKIRRLNEMYQAVIKQVTFINQHQRKLTKDNQLITEIEDIKQATEILFESIVLKVDELDGSLRQFFERLKKYLKEKDREFTQREIRQELNISKAQCSRYINTLLELEYITSKFSGNLKRVNYKIDYWDNHQKFRVEIKDFLHNQIQRIMNEKQ